MSDSIFSVKIFALVPDILDNLNRIFNFFGKSCEFTSAFEKIELFEVQARYDVAAQLVRLVFEMVSFKEITLL